MYIYIYIPTQLTKTMVTIRDGATRSDTHRGREEKGDTAKGEFPMQKRATPISDMLSTTQNA